MLTSRARQLWPWPEPRISNRMFLSNLGKLLTSCNQSYTFSSLLISDTEVMTILSQLPLHFPVALWRECITLRLYLMKYVSWLVDMLSKLSQAWRAFLSIYTENVEAIVSLWSLVCQWGCDNTKLLSQATWLFCVKGWQSWIKTSINPF